MLFKKMIRDMAQHKMQFLSIFLMAFLGVLVFSGFGAVATGLNENVNNYYDETNMADAWIYGENLNDNILDKVDNLNSTTESERQLVIDSVANFTDKSNSTSNFTDDPKLTLHFIEKNKIGKFYLLEGEEFNLSSDDGVWLDKRFADIRGLSIGDNISFTFNGILITKEIKGLGYSSEYVYQKNEASVTPDFSKNSYAYMSYEAFPRTIQYNTLLIKTSDNISDYEDQINNIIGDNYTSFISQNDFFSVHQLNSSIDQQKMIGDILPYIFVVVALLTLLTTMSRIVSKQRTQIGTLKAVGFKDRTIILHYLSYGFFLVLIGSILGLIIGPLTIPYFFYSTLSYVYTVPVWKSGFSFSFIIIAFIMVGLSLIISYLAVKNIGKEKPAEIILPKHPKTAKKSFIENSKIWDKLSFNFRWNVRDSNRNKVRGAMTIFGVIGCTILLVCAFGLNDSLHGLKDWQYGDINHYETKLIIENNASLDDIDSVTEEVDGDKIMEGAVEIKVNNIKKSGTILVDNGTSLISPTDSNRNPINLPSGVSISSKMADNLDVKLGDIIKWHIQGSDKWVETNISGIYSNPTSQGIILNADDLEDLGYNYTPSSIITSESIDGNYSGISSVISADSLMESWDKMMDSLMAMIYGLMIFASVLSIIVLYNLGLLSFTETERDMSTLKVLGFKTKDLRRILLTQNIWFSIIAYLIGVPLGYFLLRFILNSSGDSFQFPVFLSLSNLILTFTITFGLSILVNLVFSRKIRNIDMVESLKGLE